MSFIILSFFFYTNHSRILANHNKVKGLSANGESLTNGIVSLLWNPFFYKYTRNEFVFSDSFLKGSWSANRQCPCCWMLDGFKMDVKAQDCGWFPPPREGGMIDAPPPLAPPCGCIIEPPPPTVFGLAPPLGVSSGETVRQDRAVWKVLSPLGDKGLFVYKN